MQSSDQDWNKYSTAHFSAAGVSLNEILFVSIKIMHFRILSEIAVLRTRHGDLLLSRVRALQCKHFKNFSPSYVGPPFVICARIQCWQ
jgi:hypothetical protein